MAPRNGFEAAARERKVLHIVSVCDEAFRGRGIDTWSAQARDEIHDLNDEGWAAAIGAANVRHQERHGPAGVETRAEVLAVYAARARHEGAPVHELFRKAVAS